MAILIDFHNISAATVTASLYGPGALDREDFSDENIIRHLFMQSLLSYRKRYPDHGQMILCSDRSNSWRKGVFPYYKARRHDKNKVPDVNAPDWEMIYKIRNIVVDEIREHMPYLTVSAPHAEGDDCIAVLAKHFSSLGEQVVVVSNDKDFVQLKRHPGVIVYRPIENAEKECADPEAFLKEMIIRGDGGDDVPNMLSDDDVFVVKGKRQKSIMAKKLPEYMSSDLKDFADPDKVERNLNMIDFDRIPNDIADAIMVSYETAKSEKSTNRQKIFKYFVSKQLRKCLENIESF